VAEALAEPLPVYDVVIVGLGPTGATLANLLGAAGRSVLVLEKEAGIFPLPRAIHFDGEVMRIFQSTGLREEVLAISRPGAQGMHFVNAAGDTMLIRGGTAAHGPHGCANNYYAHQPELEAVLRAGLARYPQVKVRLRHELLSIAQDAEGATLGYRSADSGAQQQVRARYVVGCDGARSPVRQHIGSPMADLGLHQPWLVVDLVLEQAVQLPDYTVQHCDPRRPMTYCNVVGQRRRWEIMVMPGDDREALVQPDTIWQLLAPWVRPDQARMERAAIYTFHSVVADGWRQGRLFLAGDACHQTPPFLGQGMCAGVRDASNLAWKLDAVLAGRAPDALLNTYESERKPHVRALIELAVRLGNIIQTTDPEQAALRDAKFQSGKPEIFELPPQQLGAGAFDAAPDRVAGSPFPQPHLADGRLLDTVLGRRSAVIGSREALACAKPATVARWHDSDALVIDAPDASLVAWLQQHEALAVVVRPDRYIVGVARSGADLDRISQYLPVAP
jgi:3-(3-hydroxy-phenyl)propionate hydroxylase